MAKLGTVSEDIDNYSSSDFTTNTSSPSSLNDDYERPLLDDKVKKNNSMVGAFLAFISSILFTICGLILKQMNLNVSDVLVMRYLIQIIIVTSFVLIWRRRVKSEEENANLNISVLFHENSLTKLLMLQGMLNGVCVLSEFMCFANLPLGDASAIIFSSPLPAMIISSFVLGESLKLYKASCGIILYIGVMFVVKPTFIFGETSDETNVIPPYEKGVLHDEEFLEVHDLEDEDDFDNITMNVKNDNMTFLLGSMEQSGHSAKSFLIGIVFGLIGATSRAAHYCTCKLIYDQKQNSTHWIVLFAGCGGFLVSLLSSCLDTKHLILSLDIGTISVQDWMGILTISLLGVSALVLLNKSLSMCSPVIVSFIRVLDIVVSYVLQISVFHDTPNILAVIGSSLIILSVSFLGLENWVSGFVPINIRYLIV